MIFVTKFLNRKDLSRSEPSLLNITFVEFILDLESQNKGP